MLDLLSHGRMDFAAGGGHPTVAFMNVLTLITGRRMRSWRKASLLSAGLGVKIVSLSTANSFRFPRWW